ncbi:uncharacterized protein EDB93DRAFT_1101722 [Suillus bovinus]|uniref:uncharacterized protein n=1 Tax=Suillus bovinus TaxID=48563 RepID=UPI001B8721A6|nr:uncharacterized protein EDB93DRAFT_1101722 [Suillus bovinus]KAG2155962.1 hypothetical protein EDB93DRAFT_1101722 [Suillus bovinus]
MSCNISDLKLRLSPPRPNENINKRRVGRNLVGDNIGRVEELHWIRLPAWQKYQLRMEQEMKVLPERKTTPATATGTERANIIVVSRPSSSPDVVECEECLRPEVALTFQQHTPNVLPEIFAFSEINIRLNDGQTSLLTDSGTASQDFQPGLRNQPEWVRMTNYRRSGHAIPVEEADNCQDPEQHVPTNGKRIRIRISTNAENDAPV